MKNPADDFIAPPCSEEITILYQDEHLLLINKPSGLLSLSGKHPANLDSVHHRLVKDFPGCSLVHRLDLGTSGIMLIALNKTINALLCKQFSERNVLKRYTALLAGTVNQEHGRISAAIAKDKPNFPMMKICELEGKPAHSLFEVIGNETLSIATDCSLQVDSLQVDSLQGVSLLEAVNLDSPDNRNELALTRVELTPETGRTHQLRIHCQYMGHPIIGCDLYGTQATYQLAQRLMLHATRLEFDHPISGVRIHGYSPCPF
ncbi:RluA family pseudouridine synthase [Shewanella sp. 10N.261.52.F9]|uniref:RluA family pseudouridine synthase n=1 Tax=Shewanella sp. 10N.261.52.F9 TaxID=3229684 RepID=UPI00354B5248